MQSVGCLAKLVKQFPLQAVKRQCIINHRPCFVILQHEASASYLHSIKMQQQHERECMVSRRSKGSASAAVKSCKLIETI